ncbi:MAG: hypothetical protein COA71_07015 [SAR86 cluster bacterium]|uniref:Uncharacterized protein n=1 Tax=SAR86 cluster bacterium TaxID=2030880 RepID=A0A2A5CEF0_9GAMM|nr:hypothetical protein [Gammaproteobacteria bacterium AH-315-E17]PCJ41756.1 MAG: hypothetical protein COA71_07015 [SAR86 cluster bacterium]
MANRRQFLKIGIASSSASLAAASVKANTLRAFFSDTSKESIPFYKIIADKRYPESMAFAEEMDQRGFDVHELEGGDLTVFWNEELSKIWQTLPVAVAGVTNFRPLFCLQQLGRTYGTRVIYRGEHFYAEDGSIAHRLEGPAEMMAQCQNQLDFKSESTAGKSLAELIMGCESGATEIVTSDFAEHTGHNRPLTDANAQFMKTSYAGQSNLIVDTAAEQALTSWIIAPAYEVT